LTEGEISLDKEMKSDPCTTCQQIIYETAYSGKFKNASFDVNDPDDYSDDFEPDDDLFADLIEQETFLLTT
jgi:hypothetical protein